MLRGRPSSSQNISFSLTLSISTSILFVSTQVVSVIGWIVPWWPMPRWTVSRWTVFQWTVSRWTVPIDAGWTVPIDAGWTVSIDIGWKVSIDIGWTVSMDEQIRRKEYHDEHDRDEQCSNEQCWSLRDEQCRLDWWCTLSIPAAWRVLIDTSLVDLRIVHKPACSFFEVPRNPLFIISWYLDIYTWNRRKNLMSLSNNSKT